MNHQSQQKGTTFALVETRDPLRPGGNQVTRAVSRSLAVLKKELLECAQAELERCGVSSIRCSTSKDRVAFPIHVAVSTIYEQFEPLSGLLVYLRHTNVDGTGLALYEYTPPGACGWLFAGTAEQHRMLCAWNILSIPEIVVPDEDPASTVDRELAIFTTATSTSASAALLIDELMERVAERNRRRAAALAADDEHTSAKDHQD